MRHAKALLRRQREDIASSTERRLGERVLALIEEPLKRDPPRGFSELRRFDGAQSVGQHAGFDRWPSLGEPFVDWAGKAERLR
jgi:hypothetical protein